VVALVVVVAEAINLVEQELLVKELTVELVAQRLGVEMPLLLVVVVLGKLASMQLQVAVVMEVTV
jgi:hypothetical protein